MKRFQVICLTETKPGLLAQGIETYLNYGYEMLGEPLQRASSIVAFLVKTNEDGHLAEEPQPAPKKLLAEPESETQDAPENEEVAKPEQLKAAINRVNIPSDVDG